MRRHGLVMVTGSGPGAGKTTLVAGMEAELAGACTPVRMVREEALFERADLAILAARFRSRDYPEPGDLVCAFEAVSRTLGPDTVWLQDWSWLDLAEDLPWAVGDPDALVDFSRRLRATAKPLHPLVIYLRADIAHGLARAVRQRGQGWWSRTRTAMLAVAGPTDGDGDGDDSGDHLALVASAYAAREFRILRALEAGGWPVVEVAVAPDTSPQHIRSRAMAALGHQP